MVLLKRILATGWLVFLGWAGGAFGEEVLLVTDIHFNPFAGCYGRPGPSAEMRALAADGEVARWELPMAAPASYKQETTTGSLTGELAEIQKVAKARQITKIFVCGDLVGHVFQKDFATYVGQPARRAAFTSNMILYVLRQLREAAGGARIYYVLGNNDTDLGDYVFPSEAFRRNLSKGIFGSNGGRAGKTFEELGYSCQPFNERVVVVGLNGGLMISEKPRPELAERQLELLRADLEACRQERKRAIVLIHEPFGINPYYSFYAKAPKPVFDPPLQDAYLATLSQYAPYIAVIYAGHYHMEYLASILGKIPLFGTVALNSFFGNNPGFKVVKINERSGAMEDFSTYFQNLADRKAKFQKLYDFRKAYRIGREASVVDFISNFSSETQNPAVKRYREYFNAKSADREPIDSEYGWPYYYAAMTRLDADSFMSCMARTFPKVPYLQPAPFQKKLGISAPPP